MTPTSKDRSPLCTSELKTTQRAILNELSARKLAARKAGDDAKANTIEETIITMTRKNLALHRAKQKELLAKDLSDVTTALSQIADESKKARLNLEKAADIVQKAADFIDLLGRVLRVLS